MSIISPVTSTFKPLSLPSILRGHHRYSSNIVIMMGLRAIIPIATSVSDNLHSVPVDSGAFYSGVPIPTEGIAGNSLPILFKLDLVNKRGGDSPWVASCQRCILARNASKLWLTFIEREKRSPSSRQSVFRYIICPWL